MIIDSVEAIRQLLITLSDRAISDYIIQTNERITILENNELKKVSDNPISHELVSNFARMVCGDNALSIMGSGEPLDRDYSVKRQDGERIRFRINMTPTYGGHTITIRMLNSLPPKPSDIKLPSKLIDTVSRLKSGLVLVVGGTGSGKSTTLASIIRNMLEDHNSHKNIITLESPIEYTYHKVEQSSSVISQIDIPRHLPSFDKGIINAMRQKPNVILVGETRDPSTLKATISACQTGHLCLSTIHANDVKGTLSRLIDLCPPTERHYLVPAIANALRLIVSQQLIKSDSGLVAKREILYANTEISEAIRSSSSELPQLLEKNIERM